MAELTPEEIEFLGPEVYEQLLAQQKEKKQLVQETQDASAGKPNVSPGDTLVGEHPEDYLQSTEETKGFWKSLADTVRNPYDLMKNESMVANALEAMTGDGVNYRRKYWRHPMTEGLIKAMNEFEDADMTDTENYQILAENFDQIVHNLESQEKSQSEKGFWTMIKEGHNANPGAFWGEMINAMVADPYILAAPVGWAGAAAKGTQAAIAAGKSIRTAKVLGQAAGAASSATIGGAIGVGIDAAHQAANVEGPMDYERMYNTGVLGAAGGAAMGSLGAMSSQMVRGARVVARKAGLKRTPTQKQVNTEMVNRVREGEPVQQVVADLHKKLGLKEEQVVETLQVGLKAHEKFTKSGKIKKVEPNRRARPETRKQRYWRHSQGVGAAAAVGSTFSVAHELFVSKWGDETEKQDAIGLAYDSYNYTDELISGAKGGIALYMGLLGGTKTISALQKAALKYRPKYETALRRSDVAWNFIEQEIRAVNRLQGEAWKMHNTMIQLVPDAHEREVLLHFLNGMRKLDDLKPETRPHIPVFRKAFDDVWQMMKDSGMDDLTYLSNYIPGIYRKTGFHKAASMQEFINDFMFKVKGKMDAPENPHVNQKIFGSIEEAMANGFMPYSLDVAKMYKRYADTVTRSIMHKNMLERMRKLQDPTLPKTKTGRPQYMLYARPGKGLVPVHSPGLRDFAKRLALRDGGKVKQLLDDKGGTIYARPEVARAFKQIFQPDSIWDTEALARGAYILNFIMKRGKVSMSLFHANALLESSTFAGNSRFGGIFTPMLLAIPNMALTTSKTALRISDRVLTRGKLARTLRNTRFSIDPSDVRDSDFGLFKTGQEKFYDMMLRDMKDPTIQYAVEAGITVNPVEDVGHDFMLDFLAETSANIDHSIRNSKPGIRQWTKGIIKDGVDEFESATRVMDTYMWEKGMTSLKLLTFNQKMVEALTDNIATPIKRSYRGSMRKFLQGTEAFDADSFRLFNEKMEHLRKMASSEGLDVDALARDVARHVNDAFGGLNWIQLSRDMTQASERMGLQRIANLSSWWFSPNGRKWQQMGLFAPDWTTANLRIVSRFLPGFESNPTVQKMYAQYALRAAWWTQFYGNAANLIFSGHLMWDNPEGHKHEIMIGQDTYLSVVKQFNEVHDWMENPLYQLGNKAGSLLGFAFDMYNLREYRNKEGGDVPLFRDGDSHAEKALKLFGESTDQFSPISLSQFLEMWDEEGLDMALWTLGLGQQGKIMRIDRKARRERPSYRMKEKFEKLEEKFKELQEQ